MSFDTILKNVKIIIFLRLMYMIMPNINVHNVMKNLSKIV